MMRSKIAFIAVIALATAACGGDAADDATTTTAAEATTTTITVADTTTTTAAATTTTEVTTTTETPLPVGPHITITDSEHRTILADDAGMTLYLFIPDAQGPSTCAGSCATTWPPLIGDFAAGPGVEVDLVGSVERGDGSIQATYNGWPLYHYTPDTAPGHTRGQGLGGNWWVVGPEGDAIR